MSAEQKNTAEEPQFVYVIKGTEYGSQDLRIFRSLERANRAALGLILENFCYGSDSIESIPVKDRPQVLTEMQTWCQTNEVEPEELPAEQLAAFVAAVPKLGLDWLVSHSHGWTYPNCNWSIHVDTVELR